MSEKRFEVGYDDENNPLYVYDNQNDNTFNIPRIVDLLNKQQSDLNYLARFIGEFKVEEFKLKLRNLRILEDKVLEQQSTIEQLEKKLELKTEEVKYLKRMMVKWGMVKDE